MPAAANVVAKRCYIPATHLLPKDSFDVTPRNSNWSFQNLVDFFAETWHITTTAHFITYMLGLAEPHFGIDLLDFADMSGTVHAGDRHHCCILLIISLLYFIKTSWYLFCLIVLIVLGINFTLFYNCFRTISYFFQFHFHLDTPLVACHFAASFASHLSICLLIVNYQTPCLPPSTLWSEPLQLVQLGLAQHITDQSQSL